MTDRGLRCKSQAFTTLVDSASLTRDVDAIYRCLTLARKNGACRAFAREVDSLLPTPREEKEKEGNGNFQKEFVLLSDLF